MIFERVSDLILRRRSVLPPDKTVQRSISKAIREEAGIVISNRKIRVVKGNIYIDATPAQKNRIFTNRLDILKSVTKKTGKTHKDIR